MDKRLFVGFKVPRKIIDIINMLRSTLVDSDGYYNWVYGNNLHLKLLFLGPQELKHIEDISSRIDSISKQFNDFQIKIEGTGTFSRNNNHHALWLGINDKDNNLSRINYELKASLEDFIDSNKVSKFLPHITVARKKKKYIKNKIDVNNFMNSVYFPMEFHIKYFTLLESSVLENKVHYKTIKKFNLT